MNENTTTTAAADLSRVRLVMCGLTDATTDAYDAAEAGDLGRLALELARVSAELADVMRAVEAASHNAGTHEACHHLSACRGPWA